MTKELDIRNYEKYLIYNYKNENITVAVGMSGGVDSSVTAYILKKQGYNVIGVTMKHWEGTASQSEDSKTCCSLDDIYDAKKVCDDLNIPHYVINLEEPFKEIVVDYFIDEYLQGRTPNPCMICNRNIKLGKFIESCKKLGADYFATGHYTKLKDGLLCMGDDPKKDQVYFLSQIKKEYLKYLMFPIGELKKTEVRFIGEKLGVRVYSKGDSQEICFVEDGKYKEFLNEMTEGKSFKSGDIILTDGTVVGKHNGIINYTIGQRKGLGISHPTPLYVLKLDVKKNKVIVGENDELFKNKVYAEELNIFVENLDKLDGLNCYAKTRSRDKLHKGKVRVLTKNSILFESEDMIRGITPGQGLVLYREDGVVLASSFIK